MEPPATWSLQEIEIAKARCTQLLHGIDAVLILEEPVREGECGTPAPVRVVSIGRKPEVTFSPPALVTCDMVVGLHAWLKSDLQPLARKHLGAEIVKIETMSDYSCRNAYGRVKTRLSEHGRANALDIRGFITSKSEAVAVLDNWGMTSREVIAQAAKDQAARQAMTPRPVVDPVGRAVHRSPRNPRKTSRAGPSSTASRAPTIAIPGRRQPIRFPDQHGFRTKPPGRSQARQRRQDPRENGPTRPLPPLRRLHCRKRHCPIPARRSSSGRRMPPPAASSARCSALKPTTPTATTSTSTWPSAPPARSANRRSCSADAAKHTRPRFGLANSRRAV